MKKRRLCLLAENSIGVLAGITGLLAGKCCNLDTLHAEPDEDPAASRVTLYFSCSDPVFEQIKKQLRRNVEVIRVNDEAEL